jgi:alpha-beta hydrolase superfamily lysophospholipase
MSDVPAPRALYLKAPGADEASTFAILHPAAGAQRPTAVLLCPPFGWEDMCSYRVRREWAEQLARAGHTTLRIDLPGSGDSAGSPRDPGRLEAWTKAIDQAAVWLWSTVSQDKGRVAAIGIGLGGVAALRAAQTGAPIDELMLWAVPSRGRALVRELRALARMEVANALGEGERLPDAEPADDGAVVANGYVLSGETVTALEALDLAASEPGGPSHTTPRRALLLGADGLPADARLSEALERAGTEVTVADGPGFGAMMVETQDARAPEAVFALVGDWLAAVPAPVAHSPAPPTPAAGEAPPGVPRLAPLPAAGEAPTAHDELLLESEGTTVRERPLVLEGPGGRLFGVLTEPLNGAGELTALLLNAGPQRRTGPNRMWVEIARRWAAKGVPTLRLDSDGIGDADGDGTQLGQVTAFYRPQYVEGARAALEALAERGLPARFITLGLCSGSYWAAQAALADERVAAVMMLNPRTLVFDEWHHTKRRTRVLARRALTPATWGKVVRGEIQLYKHMETGRTLLARAASAPLRARERVLSSQRNGAPTPGVQTPAPASGEPIEALFDALRDRGQRGLLMFTGQEVLRDELANKGVLDRMERWPNLELELMGSSADTHTLTPLWLQRQVHELVDRVLEDELARARARA